jgi:hypothetical protein
VADRAVVVGGMHRSGTSFVTSFLQAMGLDVGDRLLAGDERNVHGYFEDEEFLAFQQSVLREMAPAGDPGWPDWGWTESEQLDRSVLDRRRDEARTLVAGRQGRGAWGWKDPRTTVLLDFWDELLPGDAYAFVFRSPVEVLDSILRTGTPQFIIRPDHALGAWRFYNRRLLDFAATRPGRTVIFGNDEILARPHDVAARLAVVAGDALPDLRDPDRVTAAIGATRDRALMHHYGPRDPLHRWVTARHPWAWELYDELTAAARRRP